MTEEIKTTVAEATPAAMPEAAPPPPPAEPTSTEENAPATTSAEPVVNVEDLPASELITEAETPTLSAELMRTDQEAPANDAGLIVGEAAPSAADVIAEASGITPTETVAGAEASMEEAGADGEHEASTDEDESSEGSDESKQVVRMLRVGQQVTGLVKRISEFGAFVDIGVGRDGLVHISELSPRRIAKVTDVLQEGQEATFWIKKLDRDRNRISLTMIEPGMKTIRNMEKGDLVQGTVTRLMPYGAFVDIGIGRDALLHVREMSERFVAKPEDVVTVGEQLEARIIDISRRRARVDLSIKGLRPEPEPEPQPEPERTTAAARTPAPAPQPEPEPADSFADVEVLSPFAAALRRAEESSGVRLTPRKETKKEKKSAHSRYLQEEIIERTLTGSRK
jgi:predicted RNA-binding protein with RPS1 domain